MLVLFEVLVNRSVDKLDQLGLVRDCFHHHIQFEPFYQKSHLLVEQRLLG